MTNKDLDLQCETLTIRLPRRVLTQLDQLALDNGLKRSQYIRDILRIAVENRIKVVVSGHYSLQASQPPEKP